MSTRKVDKKSKLVWNYFKNKIDIGKAECNICKFSLKNNRISNLKNHLVRLHKINLNNCKVESGCSNSVVKYSERKENIKVQLSRKTLFRSYIGLVTEDSMPFNIMNSPNLRSIVNPICAGLTETYRKAFNLNAFTCKKALKAVAEEIRCSMTGEMKNKILSLKIDSTTSLSRKILGISGQYIFNDEIKSIILGMVELKDTDASSPYNLSSEILKTLGKYEINLNQIVSITSDNSANMISAVRILSNLSVGDESESKYFTEDQLQNISNLQKPLNMNAGNIQICRCVVHTAQLCALDVTKEPYIKEFLFSCRNLVKFIQNIANGFKDTLEFQNLKIPQLDDPTKWCSTYSMLDALLSAKEVLITAESIKEENNDENFDNCETLWDFIESYVSVFGPLHKTIIKFQEEHLHYGDFYAEWLKCEILTKKVLSDNPSKELVYKIGIKLLECLENRTANILQNESLSACLFLDPRFHHTLSLQKRQEAITYLKRMWEKLRANSIVSSTSSVNIFQTNETPFEDEGEELLNSFLKEKLESTSDDIVCTDAYSKIINLHLPFMRSNADILMFWKERKYSEPELYALSSVCFGIPPTQVIIEPAFSSLNLILTGNRNRVNHDTLEDILLVKLNPTFINETINSEPLFEDLMSESD